jgi:glycosyltransferase involved in cell wall biosynthesis
MISLAVCTHNEGEYIEQLLDLLVTVKQNNSSAFEIVVLDDYSTDPDTLRILTERAKDIDTFVRRNLEGDFASHKNFLTDSCRGEWILNLDADELMDTDLLDALPELVAENPDVEAFWLPRVNTVEGMTPEHVAKWGWQLTTHPNFDLPLVNFPDYQLRLYKNTPTVRWMNRVHETLTGYSAYSMLPADPQYAILHHKKIDRQEQQNTFYETIQRSSL